MKVKLWLCSILILSLLLSGCWDRVEINDIAIIMGTAFDITPEGKLEMTLQLMLPSPSGMGGAGGGGGGEQEEKFVVETSAGTEPGDVMEKIQEKISRRLFRGHRRVIVFGEELARKGLDEILDSLSRDPQNRLRTHIVIAKGMKGRELLKIKYPFERIPSEAMREMEKLGVGVELTIRDFLMTASGEGIQPVAAAMEPTDDKKGFQLTGTAVFKDLKLVGYLNDEETRGYLWVSGKLKNGTLSTSIPGSEGEVSIDIMNAKSKIKPEIEGNKVKVYVELSGEGVIHGNGTKLDLTVPENIELIEETAKKAITDRVQSTIKGVQKKYKSDIFGFGSHIYQTDPGQWDELKDKWDEIFPEAEAKVSMDFTIKRTGMSGPPLHLKEDEVKK